MMRRIYLDYAASTPVDRRVVEVMRPYFSEIYGNPGSAHWFGQQSSAAIFQTRETVAAALNCHYDDLIFTGSATESNNMALRGFLRGKEKPRVIVSAIEHSSIMATARHLTGNGVDVVTAPVGRDGVIDLKKLKAALNKRTALVSVMYANSEIGVLQPIKEIGKMVAEFRGDDAGGGGFPLFHCDAVQAFQYLRCDVEELGVDLLTLSAHKIYGPKGIGVLYVRDLQNISGKIEPLISGEGREFGLRGGTENTPCIVGFGRAVELAEKLREKEAERVRKLRDYFWRELRKIVPKIELNGSLTDRLPNNLNIYFPGRPAQDLVVELDIWGVSVSAGTACAAGSVEPSPVITALGYNDDRPYSSLRITFGRQTTKSQLNAALAVFRKRFKAD